MHRRWTIHGDPSFPWAPTTTDAYSGAQSMSLNLFRPKASASLSWSGELTQPATLSYYRREAFEQDVHLLEFSIDCDDVLLWRRREQHAPARRSE